MSGRGEHLRNTATAIQRHPGLAIGGALLGGILIGHFFGRSEQPLLSRFLRQRAGQKRRTSPPWQGDGGEAEVDYREVGYGKPTTREPIFSEPSGTHPEEARPLRH